STTLPRLGSRVRVSFLALNEGNQVYLVAFFFRWNYMYWGYIIYSKSKDRFYVGTTGVGPQIRLDRHNDGWTRSTKAGIPWELKFIQTFDNKSEASKWERMVKKQKSRAYLEHLIHLDLNEFKKLP
ncbi:MAG: GIY-YIG nuclease family protein, partial [Balneolaceae bacterium]